MTTLDQIAFELGWTETPMPPRRSAPIRADLAGLDRAFDDLARTLRSQVETLRQQQDEIDSLRLQLRALQDEAWAPALGRD
jgi:hypothetical protein